MAREFNGSSQYIEAASAVLSGVPITMACWFNLDDITANHSLIAIEDVSAATTYFQLQALGGVGGDPLRCITRSGANGNAVTSTGYSADTWQHACAVFAAVDDRTIYLNAGSSNNDTTSITPANLDRTTIGVRNTSGLQEYANGEIAEVGIWNVALTAAEVTALAAGYSPALIRPENLVTYLPLVRAIIDIAGGVTFVNTNTSVSPHMRIVNPNVSTFGLLTAPYVPALLFGAHPSEEQPRVDTSSGIPLHTAPQGTFYWDTSANKLYVNNDGGTGWTVIN